MADHTLSLLVLFLVMDMSLSTRVPVLKKCTKYSECKLPARLESPSNMTTTSFDKSFCFCDSECSLLNDCCPDASPNQTTHTLTVASQYWSCQKQPFLNARHKALYMVSSCPENHSLQGYCSSTLPEFYDYKMDIPVLSLSTGEWFKNIYCATCHGYHSNLRPVNFTLSCSGNSTPDRVLEPVNYVRGALMWSKEDANCSLQMEFEDDGIIIVPWERPCVETVSLCPDTWSNETVAELCSSYALFVERVDQNTITSHETVPELSVSQLPFTDIKYFNDDDLDPTVYKNPHCALCNGVPLKDIKCYSGRLRRRPSPRSPSLRVIMDFSWDVSHEFCHLPDGLWDGIHECCQYLNTTACALISTQHSGCCIPHSRRLNDSCPRTVFKAGEYRLFINNSLEITVKNTEFSGFFLVPGEYEVLRDGSLEICDIPRKGLVNLEPFQEYLTIVCLSISVICLVLHLIIHALLPKLHNLPGKNLQSLSIALLVAQLGFLVGIKPVIDIPYHVCVSIAVLLHFSYLAAFCWMNVMSIDIWRTFSTTRVGGRLSTHLKYSLYAWGSPAVVSLIALVAHYTSFLPSALQPHFALAGTCWFGNKVGLGIFMAVPVTAILVANILLFFRTVYVLHKKQESRRYLKKKAKVELAEASSQNHGGTSPIRKVTTGPRDQIRFYLYVKLFIIMGLSWITGAISVLTHLQILWYPYIILNGLQGAFIFIMFDVKRNILVMLWERVLGADRPLPSFLVYHSTGTGTDSSGTQTTSSTNLRSSVTSDHVHLPLMAKSREFLSRKLPSQRKNSQTSTTTTSLHYRTSDKIGNGHFEVT